MLLSRFVSISSCSALFSHFRMFRHDGTASPLPILLVVALVVVVVFVVVVFVHVALVSVFAVDCVDRLVCVFSFMLPYLPIDC
jgi:hypothetical protein